MLSSSNTTFPFNIRSSIGVGRQACAFFISSRGSIISTLLFSHFTVRVTMLCLRRSRLFPSIAPFAYPVGKWLSSRIHTFISRFLASSRITSMSFHHFSPKKSGCGRLSTHTARMLLSRITFIYSRKTSSDSPCCQKNGKI